MSLIKSGQEVGPEVPTGVPVTPTKSFTTYLDGVNPTHMKKGVEQKVPAHFAVAFVEAEKAMLGKGFKLDELKATMEKEKVAVKKVETLKEEDGEGEDGEAETEQEKLTTEELEAKPRAELVTIAKGLEIEFNEAKDSDKRLIKLIVKALAK